MNLSKTELTLTVEELKEAIKVYIHSVADIDFASVLRLTLSDSSGEVLWSAANGDDGYTITVEMKDAEISPPDGF